MFDSIENKPQMIKKHTSSVIWLAILFISACSTKTSLHAPPILEQTTKHHQTSKFVWFDLLTDDVAAAQQFYASIFDWQFKTDPAYRGSSLIISKGKIIGSIVAHNDATTTDDNAEWLSSMSVDNVEQAS